MDVDAALAAADEWEGRESTLAVLAAEVRELREQRANALAIHRRMDSSPWCEACHDDGYGAGPLWPCPTVIALGAGAEQPRSRPGHGPDATGGGAQTS